MKYPCYIGKDNRSTVLSVFIFLKNVNKLLIILWAIDSLELEFLSYNHGSIMIVVLIGLRTIIKLAEATPKALLRTMGVKGLTLFHLKSHLQV